MAARPDDYMEGQERDYRDDGSLDNSLYSSNGNAGRATYFSADNRTKTAVYASTPVGSKHAARIQKICGSIHAKAIRDPSPSSPAKGAIQYERSHTRILPAERVVEEVPTIAETQGQHQPQPQTQATRVQQQQQQQQQQPYWPTAVTAPPARTRSSVKVMRYEEGGRLAYHSKSDRGELYVSAPQSSQEATMFEEIARRAMAGNRDSGSRRIVEQEQEEVEKQEREREREREREQQQQRRRQLVVRGTRGWGWF